jgi:hypothetical protein
VIKWPDYTKTALFGPEQEQRERQRALFAGLDCLPGQMDLIETDGEERTNNQNSAAGSAGKPLTGA